MKYEIDKSSILRSIDDNVTPHNLSGVDVIVDSKGYSRLLSGSCMETLTNHKNFRKVDLYVPIPYKYLFATGDIKTKKDKLSKLQEYIDYINTSHEGEIMSIVDDKEVIDNIFKTIYLAEEDIIFKNIRSKYENLFKNYSISKSYNIGMIPAYELTAVFLCNKFRMDHSSSLIYRDYRNYVSQKEIENLLLKYADKVVVNSVEELLELRGPHLVKPYDTNYIKFAHNEFVYNRRGLNDGGLIDIQSNKITYHAGTYYSNSEIYAGQVELHQVNDFKYDNFKDIIHYNYNLEEFKITFDKDESVTLYKMKDLDNLKILDFEIIRLISTNYIKYVNDKASKLKSLSDLMKKRIELMTDYVDNFIIPLLSHVIDRKPLIEFSKSSTSIKEELASYIKKFNSEVVLCKVNRKNFKSKNMHSNLYLLTLLRYCYFGVTGHLGELILNIKNTVKNKYSFFQVVYSASNIHLDTAWHRYNLVKCREYENMRQPILCRMRYKKYSGDEQVLKRLTSGNATLNSIFSGKEVIRNKTKLHEKLILAYKNKEYEKIVKAFI